jgi:D-beta-D-heptose 7-phosphate kinase/D-beta-D-heptose 1-phosphate adenosyltransferase
MSGEVELLHQIDALANARVLVVGDVMLDRYLYGAVERISPEAPIPVLRIESEAVMLGGAGNVLRNLAALGAEARLFAVVGDDESGRLVERLAGEQGESRVIAESGRATTIKERFIGAAQQLLRADRESGAGPEQATQKALLEGVSAALDGAGALVLSDYGKGLLTREFIERLASLARERGVGLLVDPKGRNFSRYRGADLITPNRRELSEATGQATLKNAEVVAAAKTLIETTGFGAVLATRSERGMTLVQADGAVQHLPAEAREVFDVSGAGDTVVATMAAARAGGLDWVSGARLANLAAGIVVGKLGTAVAHPWELRRALQASHLMSAEAKVVDQARATDLVRDWRARGLVVGFTNGCFDLLHPGHVSLLQQARQQCDRLIVGLNSDASVRRLKGETRPVQDEVARSAVLGSLAAVDAVVIFEEDTPLALLELLRPDLLVKGADYSRAEVVGGDLVESYGGRVHLAEVLPGHSTSETLRKLQSKA